jgi:hypothetical protein
MTRTPRIEGIVSGCEECNMLRSYARRLHKVAQASKAFLRVEPNFLSRPDEYKMTKEALKDAMHELLLNYPESVA